MTQYKTVQDWLDMAENAAQLAFERQLVVLCKWEASNFTLGPWPPKEIENAKGRARVVAIAALICKIR